MGIYDNENTLGFAPGEHFKKAKMVQAIIIIWQHIPHMNEMLLEEVLLGDPRSTVPPREPAAGHGFRASTW